MGNKKVLFYEGMFLWMFFGVFNVIVLDFDGNFIFIFLFSIGEYVGYIVMVVVRNNFKLYYGFLIFILKFNYIEVF